MFSRRFRMTACLMLATIGLGCDSSGPVVSSVPSKPAETSATAPTSTPKTFDRGRALNAGEASPEGLPDKATP